ncbi:hypothetical protein [Streptomyces zagrosensis]|uniref:DUF4232 domain-containing protein n=1 Tax=Streptomyces zagrosensis TaxID=1042984 RepID=A0A7W9UX93_9ACTN|nr:hypothetical protein [Streptomyces zagrosensis]MBB5934367.1 hypothetical protein [Streptomyces zagrosensis]
MNHEGERPGGPDRQDGHGQRKANEAAPATNTAARSAAERTAAEGASAGPDADECAPSVRNDARADTNGDARADDQPGQQGRPGQKNEAVPRGGGGAPPLNRGAGAKSSARGADSSHSDRGAGSPASDRKFASRFSDRTDDAADSARTDRQSAPATRTGVTGATSLVKVTDPGPDAADGKHSGVNGARAREGRPNTALDDGFDDLMGIGGGLDEQALRCLLQGAVEDLEPAPQSLDHIRRAVPVRRTRRRQALVGAAAAIVLGGAAIPALVHVTAIGDASDSRPANAASSERTHDQATGGHHGEGGPSDKPEQPSKKEKEKEEERKEKAEEEKREKDKPSKTPSRSAVPPLPDSSNTLAATSPTCGRDQLGDGGSSVGAADGEGRVYGSFRVVNTSGDPCTVEDSGVVGAVAQGSANPSGVQVVDHTAGDPATELPPPSAASEQLILRPGQAYEVRYAWIPAPGGGPTGCSNTGTPSPQPTTGEPQKLPVEGEPGTEVPGDTGGAGTGGGGGEEPPAPSSVLISHTPDAGDPAVASATVPEACSGTVYHTGALAKP